MRWLLWTSIALLACASAAVAEEVARSDAAPPQISERDAWRSEIAAQRARAEAQRQQLKADLAKRKAEALSNPEPQDLELARRASEQVLRDDLRRGDIVSTMDGLFMFVGKGDGERSAADFVPLGPRRR